MDAVLYSIESPKYHLFDINDVNTLQGWVLYFGSKRVQGIKVYYDDDYMKTIPVEVRRDDVAAHIPSVPEARYSGFQGLLPFQESVQTIWSELIYDDGSAEHFFDYPVHQVVKNQAMYQRWIERLCAMSRPDIEHIFLTQGHTNAEEYTNSILPAAQSFLDYLRKAGVSVEEHMNVLDFGCGAGRMLQGLHAVDPGWVLFGCDYNSQLIDWNRMHLPKGIECSVNALHPPLEYKSDQFDCIYLISVFTHLSLNNQRQWIEELTRILRPGGVVLITLQGEVYARNVFHQQPEKMREFEDVGYADTGEQTVEGENRFAALHSPAFACQLFAGFELAAWFPQGNMPGQRKIFPIALAQDVYLFRSQKKGDR